jgi:hypothetical protein
MIADSISALRATITRYEKAFISIAPGTGNALLCPPGMLGLTETSGNQFDDVAGNTFEGDIDRIVTAGIGFGCDTDSYCPNRPLIREEMAEMLVRAFGYDNPDGIDFFTDDGSSVFHESINELANHGVTLGCDPPDNDRFCPDRTLTRGEMASFFARALDL